VVVACVLIFVVFYDNIFKDDEVAAGTTIAGQKVDLSEKSTPSAIMAASMANVGTAPSLVGSFDMKVDIEADTSSMPEEMAQMFKDPITLSGSLAYKSAEQAGDIKLSLGMMGQNMDVAIRLLGDRAWIGLADQWYEAPPDTQQELATSGVSETLASVQKMLSNLSVDPSSWLKDQAPVKEEKIDGVKVLHLSGSNPDWTKMLGDLSKIMTSPEYQSLMSSAGSTVEDLQSQLPSPDELTQMQTELDAALKNVTIDVWVEKDTARLRKMTMVCDVVPPAAGDTGLDGGLAGSLDLSGSGISKLNLQATVTLDPNKSVDVKAPSSAKPYDQLQTDIEANPSLLGPLGGLLMGMGSGF
jgi:hypothetical protein